MRIDPPSVMVILSSFEILESKKLLGTSISIEFNLEEASALLTALPRALKVIRDDVDGVFVMMILLDPSELLLVCMVAPELVITLHELPVPN